VSRTDLCIQVITVWWSGLMGRARTGCGNSQSTTNYASASPDQQLCIVFDIDGTILDLRHLVVYALLGYDREHGSEYFHGLRAEDVTVHENRIDEFLRAMALPAAVRADVMAWYDEHLWSPDGILAANQPYRGVLGVIRWFQLQPSTCVALNTGRPEEIRDLTLQGLNSLGKAYRVTLTRNCCP